jgi:hypothetical protein
LFSDANKIFSVIKDNLQSNFYPKIVGVIHGDFWFSNIIITYDDKYKCIDMKGKVDNVFTMNGDSYYDYGKLYQSILGYDLILNDCKINETYVEKIKQYFLKKCIERELNIEYLYWVTKSLIFGTFHFIENTDTKNRVWDFLKKI